MSEIGTCASCRFWRRWDYDPNLTVGDCLLISDDPSIPKGRDTGYAPTTELAAISPWAGSDGGGLRTAEKFGCRLWQWAREVPEEDRS